MRSRRSSRRRSWRSGCPTDRQTLANRRAWSQPRLQTLPNERRLLSKLEMSLRRLTWGAAPMTTTSTSDSCFGSSSCSCSNSVCNFDSGLERGQNHLKRLPGFSQAEVGVRSRALGKLREIGFLRKIKLNGKLVLGNLDSLIFEFRHKFKNNRLFRPPWKY